MRRTGVKRHLMSTAPREIQFLAPPSRPAKGSIWFCVTCGLLSGLRDENPFVINGSSEERLVPNLVIDVTNKGVEKIKTNFSKKVI